MEYEVRTARTAKAARGPSKIRAIRRSDVCRDYVWTGGAIPRLPVINGVQHGVLNGGKVVVTVQNKADWGGLNQAIANAIARIVGGERAKSV